MARRTGDGAQVAAVDGEEGLHRAVGLLQPAQILLYGFEVVETGGHVGDELLVESGEPVGEDVGQLFEVELAGQVRPAQDQQ